MTAGEKLRRLTALYSRIQSDPEYRGDRMGVAFVPGRGCLEGHPLVLVGEAPGEKEEREKSPFVGPAGRNLDTLLSAAQLSREEVYVTNLIKYRPITARGTNRGPTQEERRRALPFLLEELGILQPRLIVCLGLSSAKSLLQSSDLTMRDANGSLFLREPWKILVTYHPSPHNWASPEKKAALQRVFQKMNEIDVGRRSS